MSLKSRKSGGVLAVKYVILTDAACDLDPGVLKTADLAVIPMEYIQQQETLTPLRTAISKASMTRRETAI